MLRRNGGVKKAVNDGKRVSDGNIQRERYIEIC